MNWDNTSFVDIKAAALAKKWWFVAVAAALVVGFVLGKL